MNRKRLIRLRDVVLKNIPKGQLNMKEWTCGTKACLAGWALRDHPTFRREGLDVTDNFNPEYLEMTGFEALQLFFDLSEFQTERLFAFNAFGRPVPQRAAVRQRINEILEKGK